MGEQKESPREQFIAEMYTLVEILDRIEKQTPFQAVEPMWIDDLRIIRKKAVDCIRKTIKSQ